MTPERNELADALDEIERLRAEVKRLELANRPPDGSYLVTAQAAYELRLSMRDAVAHKRDATQLRSDVERLARELREARAAIREDSTACVAEECDSRATHWIADGWFCDHHAPKNAHEMRHAPAIRAAEKDGGE